MKGPSFCRQGNTFVTRTSELLSELKSFLPREFLRKGRTLREIERGKATEFRQFLLYTGPVVLKSTLPSNLFKHFRLFSVAIFCLASPMFCEAYCDYAKQLLILFVSQFGQFYGQDQYVYNVHSLVHLADDVATFGEFEKCSAFAFESFLGKLKRLVRKPNNPLQQVIRRLSENQHSLHQSNTPKIPPCGFVKKRHRRGPCPREYCTYMQFEQLVLPDCYLSVDQGDNCILSGGRISQVTTITQISTWL